MQISRLFQILYILLERKTTTAVELAERFEVSTRTIYRDIEALSQAGIPVYTTQGKGGGISLTESFVLNKSLISEKDQSNMLLALQSLSATHYPEFGELLGKLQRFFMKDNTNWLEVDFSTWGSNAEHREKFYQLKEAILNQQTITFSYYGSSAVKSCRTISPKKLLFKDRAWYIQGYCHERMANRTFKLTRITDINTSNDPYTYLNIDSMMPTSTLSTSDVHKVELKLRISSEAAYRIYDDFGEKDITVVADDSFIVNTEMPSGEWIFNHLLSYGPLLEVLEPESIRLDMSKRIHQMAKNYFL